MRKIQSIIFVAVLGVVFASFSIVFNCFPRSVVSELENRELAKPPRFSWEKLMQGVYMSEVSSWYSDSEPYRDYFMALSMEVDNVKKLHWSTTQSDDNVTFIAGDDAAPEKSVTEADSASAQMNVDDKAKIANLGIVLLGTEPNVRAMMAYRGESYACHPFASIANKYHDTFGDNVNIYCMIIPTSIEFYCPEKAKSRMKSQHATIVSAHEKLKQGVKPVDVYTPLSEHRAEDIYLRTDHHWAPLGAYYAAQALAHTAGVPFNDLSHYERCVVKRYVGSMHRYSKDITVKNSPEDFVYYIPKGIDYSTIYINYRIDEEYNVIGVGSPMRGQFFHKFNDGSGSAYCTFMGSDTKITQVRTATKNSRRLIILKDSYGNAIPGYLFFSFEEIHIIDSRYFHYNMVSYVKEHKITDIVLANNITFACSYKTINAYRDFLTQQPGDYRKKVQSTIEKPIAANDTIPQKSSVQHNSELKQAPSQTVDTIKNVLN